MSDKEIERLKAAVTVHEERDARLRREGAAQMRERCARFVEQFDARIANIDERDAVLADNIRELPLTEQGS